MDWEGLLDKISGYVKRGDIEAAASEVKIFYTEHTLWRLRAWKAVESYARKWGIAYNQKLPWEAIFGVLITREALFIARYIAERLGYPLMRAHWCSMLSTAGAGLANNLLRKGGRNQLLVHLEPRVVKAVAETGWSREEVERWIALGVAVAAYLLLDPQRLEYEVSLLPATIEQCTY